MALNNSGPISLGGSTSGQSVNLELGKSATAQISFNDTAVRGLTGTSSGTALIMPTNFYGKSVGLDTQTVTTGTFGTAPDRLRGYSSGQMGSISTGTSAIYGLTIDGIYYDENAMAYFLSIPGASNSGWTTMTIAGTKALTRASATYSGGGWYWGTTDIITNQAFGTNGTVVSVVFT